MNKGRRKEAEIRAGLNTGAMREGEREPADKNILSKSVLYLKIKSCFIKLSVHRISVRS